MAASRCHGTTQIQFSIFQKKKKGISPNAEHLMNKYPSHVKIKEPKPTKLI
jgi:hypothetical protein